MDKKQENIIIKSLNQNSKNGIIAFVNVEQLPKNAMSEVSDIKGKVFMVGAKTDNKESIINSLCDLGIIDDFDDKKREIIIDLAMDLLTHNGELNIQ